MKAFIAQLPRYLLGFIYLASGIVGLFNLVPPPQDMPEKMKIVMDGFMASGYFFPLLKGTEIVAGFLLLARIAPALALVVLAPITLNIVLTHLFVTPGIQNQVVPFVMLALHLLAAKNYQEIFKPLFRRN